MTRRRAPARAGTKDHASERVDARLGRFQSDGTIAVEITGRRVRVEGGIPNETVRLSLTGRRDRPRAEVVSVLDPSPERLTPRCKVVEVCGGCEWQHLRHGGQLTHIAAIVRRLLAAKRLPTRIDAIHPMDDPWSYRIRVQIALGPEAGFRMRGSKQIVGLRSCPVAHPAISRLLEDLNRLIRLRELPDYRGRVMLHTQVVGSESEPRLQLLLEGVDRVRLDLDGATRACCESLAGLRNVESVSVQAGPGEAVTVAGPAVSQVRLRDRDLALPPGSFFQSNWSLLPRLLDRVLDLASVRTGEVAADIYGGVGLFGLFLAEQGARVILVEVDPRAVAAARESASAWGLTTMEFVAAPAERAVVELPHLDLALVDPPRTGLDLTTVSALIERRVPRIIYVSCSPVSYARDAAQLVRAGYRVDRYELFDFYPQSGAHIEGLARLVWDPTGRGDCSEVRSVAGGDPVDDAGTAN
jgi:23S rRNA (uracil1939-C5)-methyltransferase